MRNVFGETLLDRGQSDFWFLNHHGSIAAGEPVKK